MKLYTEEQVRKAARADTWKLSVNEILETLTPIELPSDEEIEKEIQESIYSIEYDTGFIEGALWLKKQILNQNK